MNFLNCHSVVVLNMVEVQSDNPKPLDSRRGSSGWWPSSRVVPEKNQYRAPGAAASVMESQITDWDSVPKLKIIPWWPPEQQRRRQRCSQRLYKSVLALMTLFSRTWLLLTHLKKTKKKQQRVAAAAAGTWCHGSGSRMQKERGHVGTRTFCHFDCTLRSDTSGKKSPK